MDFSNRVKQFIEGIAEPTLPGIFNPWKERCETDMSPDAPLLRQDRLRAHLSCPGAKLLLIGEAPGYQGCRYSGVAFTSERLLLEGAIPRIQLTDRITSRPKPWSEPSATIVWGALQEAGIEHETVLFNAVPWHPVGPRGIHSNRTPTQAEKDAGVPHLLQFLALYPDAQVAAVGNTASDSLTTLGIAHITLRHPANGGATKFRTGLSEYISTRG